MEFQVLGSEAAGPTLRLDHEEFAYAGKFVMSSTGKSIVREADQLLGAVAFSEDSTDPTTVRLRYVTVRESRRGEGVGPRLLRFTADALAGAYDTVDIAVNNPMAYEACYRAGFVYTGEQTGIAELRMVYRPGERESDRYRSGFERFRERDLPPAHEAVCDRHADGDPPAVVDVPA
ncbi:GNAT family N-acetyltransferase [Halovenus sp. WSH3]|uniref:GNAT family N-acetyltransferase n=1 Tax=Halovenus carboxidivorans TaxID=2692199 RepID=A0A6B0T411_9EURY|nr:GNAT family N-acetyltransferase [Halovenus carboxidivorans]MXR52815.1 GNAT family N-acetyltransferase [Halovenus carboxidivorans]